MKPSSLVKSQQWTWNHLFWARKFPKFTKFSLYMAAQGPIWAQNTWIFSFHGRTGNNETMRMPENTLHDFLGPLASGFWPENALDLDILAICGGSRSILSSNYLYI